jgi:hemolysin activation/secretion protein
MKNLTLLTVIFWAASSVCVLAQGVNPLAPSALNPKPLPKQPPPTAVPQRPKSPRTPEGDKPMSPDQPDLKIKAIVIVKSQNEIHPEGVPGAAGLMVHDIPFLAGPDFRQTVEPFIGRLLTENAVRDLEDTIILYCRVRGKILVDMILPGQNISEGILQLWFLEGQVGKITVNNEGRKWFSDNLIRRNVRLKPGDSIDSNKLTQDLNWLNNNPFREVDVAFKPGDKLGYTDVELRVDDRFPVRPYIGYEDSGTRFTGEERLLGGFNWGNVFGLDQQLNYQYSTDINFDLVQAQSGSYIIPLPWRHTITLYGSYVDGKALFSPGSANTTANVHTWQSSIRYAVPLPNVGPYEHGFDAGFDFSRGNNNLLAGGNTVLQNANTDIAQFVAGYNGALPDPWGRTIFGSEFYYSPGGLTDDNTDAAFNQLRTGAMANYFYARANLERMTKLPWNCLWIVRVWGQFANARLHPDDELSLGGYNTVRGYDERVISGDEGLVVENELRSPPLFPSRMVGVPQVGDGLQFLGFFDYAFERQEVVLPADGTDPNKTLYSVGLGLRYTIRKNLAVRFDYGFPLTEKSLNERSSRGHVGVLLSF